MKYFLMPTFIYLFCCQSLLAQIGDLEQLNIDFEKEIEAEKAIDSSAKVLRPKKEELPAKNNPLNFDLDNDQILSGEALKDTQLRFKGEKNSSIDWSGKTGAELLDYKKWKTKILNQEKDDRYLVLSRAKDNHEIMGRVISCVGTCMAQRESMDYRLQQKSRLNEGDEVYTAKDSYLWIALSSGEILRLAPESSLFLREINYRENEIFYFLRINQGFVKFASRLSKIEKIEAENEFMTDHLAMPLYPEASNPPALTNEKKNAQKDYLQRYLDIVKTNNTWREKIKSQFMISLPNGILRLENASLDIFTGTLSKTYFKVLKENNQSQAQFISIEDATEAQVAFDEWQEITFDGMSMSKLKVFKQVIFDGEVFFKSIIPLRFSSEMLMRLNLAKVYEEKLSGKVIAMDYGIFRWDLLLSKEAYEKRKVELLKWALFLEKGNRDKSILSLTEKGKIVERDNLKEDVHLRALKLLEVKK